MASFLPDYGVNTGYSWLEVFTEERNYVSNLKLMLVLVRLLPSRGTTGVDESIDLSYLSEAEGSRRYFSDSCFSTAWRMVEVTIL
jgi:hypothetical protein